MACKVEEMYAEFKEIAERFRRFEEEERIAKAIESAKQLVYDKLNIFDGYDPEGYLGCYETEMKNRGVPETLMITAFEDLIHFEFKDKVQELASCHSNQWSNFANALVYASFAELEPDYLTWEKQEQSGNELRNNASCASVRAKLEAIVNACLMEDNQLLFKADAEIVETVYAKLKLEDAIRDQQGLYNAKMDALLL